ncbi:MAG: hypothetical protein HYT79_00010 [Elusimicrobia bacterium]|nr:hypothetical protein [Elusimicrobiota bacterium]
MSLIETRKLLDETIEEIALVLGGIFAVHGVADEVVWQAMKHLDMSHDNALARLEESAPSEEKIQKTANPAPRPHPAIDALLMNLSIKRRNLILGLDDHPKEGCHKWMNREKNI